MLWLSSRPEIVSGLKITAPANGGDDAIITLCHKGNGAIIINTIHEHFRKRSHHGTFRFSECISMDVFNFKSIGDSRLTNLHSAMAPSTRR